MCGKNGKLLMFGLFFIFCCKETTSECKQLTPCSCKFSNGYGYSLWTLANSTPYSASIDENRTLLFHPCTNEVLTHNSECNKESVSVCLDKGNDSLILGKAEETHITIKPVKSVPMLVINHGNYTITITLDCCASCPTTTLSNIPTNNSKEYTLSLSSHYACGHYLSPKGLSTGSLLLIYFFSFTGLYFIVGAIALKLTRGATGWELVPDHKFWLELPSYVKDGFIFTINCCHASSYQSI
ncbi:hypothetical protein ANTPLA_LOCUS8861 [Anthophora plagiata]